MPTKQNFKIYQGSTFREVIRWESATKGYAPITAITKSAPIVITSTTHSIPVGWRVKPTNILGMTELNSTDTYYTVSSVATNTVTLNAVNSLGFKDYVSGGVLEYNVPTDLTGYTARMQIRSKLEDTIVIEELTTENGKIVIDEVGKAIILELPFATTTGYAYAGGVYSLEMQSSTGIVTVLCTGNIPLVKEITRT